jgi:hypothetical protein
MNTNGVLESFLVPCRSVSMVKHSALLSMTRPVLHLSSPAPNARLVHVEIIEGRPSKAVHQYPYMYADMHQYPYMYADMHQYPYIF